MARIFARSGADARNFFAVIERARLAIHTRTYPLEQANEALSDLREGRVQGAAVLVP